MSTIFLLQIVLFFMENLSNGNWNMNRVQRSYESTASEMFWLPESTSPTVKGALAIFTLILELYDIFAGLSSDLLFFITVLFLRSLIAETISEIKSVNFSVPNPSASCLMVQHSTINPRILEYIRNWRIKSSNSDIFKQVLEIYRSLRQLTHDINNVCGVLSLWFLSNVMVYVCQMLNTFTTSTDYLNVFEGILFVTYVSLMLFWAADTHKLVSTCT